MKTKIYCVVETSNNFIVGAYSKFEDAMHMAKAYYGVTNQKHRIQTIDYDFIDFSILAKHIEKKVLDTRRSS